MWQRSSFILVFGGMLLAGCRHGETYQKPLTPVVVRTVESYTEDAASRFSGSVEPETQINLAFKTGGYVDGIMQVAGADGRRRNLQEGDRVSRGAVLARVRQADYQAKLGEAKSALAQSLAAVDQGRFQLAEAAAGRDQARLDFARASNLFGTQSLTKPEYEMARAKLEASQARVDQAVSSLAMAKAKIGAAQGQVEEAELALHDSEMRAPIDGWVLKRNIETGNLVGPSTVAFVLAETGSVKVIFGVPDLLLPRLKPGLLLSVTTEALPDAAFNGRITRLSPAADPKSRVFDCEITILNPGNRLKPGMIAVVEVAHGRMREPVPAVPLTAIVRSADHKTEYGVFVIEREAGNTLARARDVELGESFGNLVAVKGGVRPGDRVIVTGATLVRDGEPVQVTP